MSEQKDERSPGEKGASEVKKDDENGFTDEEKKKAEVSPLEKAENELAKEKEESARWKNEYYKAYADLDNLRKSLEKDHAEALKYRSEGFLENLLPALDSFYIALESTPQSEEARNYRTGFQYIYNQIQSALTSEGVKEILPKIGDEFNPQFMHALDTVESDGPENKVAAVLMKGYQLKDRLVRPVMVKVTKKKVADIKKEPTEASTPVKDMTAHKA